MFYYKTHFIRKTVIGLLLFFVDHMNLTREIYTQNEI